MDQLLQEKYNKGDYYFVYYKILELEANKKLTIETFTVSELVDYFYLKLTCLVKLNFINDALSEIANLYSTYKYDSISKLKLIIVHLRALIDKGNLLQALEIIYQGDFELKLIGSGLSNFDEKIIALYYHVKGTIFFYRGELDKSIEFLRKALTIRENYQDIQGISDSINNMGMVYQQLGEFELATKCYLECISLDQSLKYEKGISISLNNLGFISLQTGDLEEALNYFLQSYNLIKKISKLENSSDELDHKFLDLILINFEDYTFVGELFSNLATTLYAQGRINESLLNYAKSLYVYQKTNNSVLISDLLIQLIAVHLELGNLNQSTKYIEMLHKMNESESKIIQIRIKYSIALVKNKEKKFKSKSEAQGLFYYIIKNEILDWNITIKSMTYLAESLIEEFMFFEDPDIIEEAKNIIDKMHTIAKDKKSFSLLTEMYLLKMKFAVIEGYLDKAILMLDQAYFTSSEKNLGTLLKKVKIEQKKIQEEYQDWKDFLKNSSIKERFEKIEIVDYMNKIKSAITPFKE